MGRMTTMTTRIIVPSVATGECNVTTEEVITMKIGLGLA
jgi:hypothetical protein